MANYTITEEYYSYTNDTYNTYTYSELADPFGLKHGVLATIILSVAYSLVFVLGVVGNGFVVAVVVRSPRMRSVTNLFIVNLACADLLVNVLCLPFTLIANLIPAWVLGTIICKGVAYLQGVSVSASVNTLMAISVERCLAISHPLNGSMTSRSCKAVVAIIWMFALSINLPWIVVFTLEPIGIRGSKAQICTELWPNQETENLYFVLANLVVCYLAPLVMICCCYGQIWRQVALRKPPGEQSAQIILNRSKVKVLKMLLVVIVTFAISWLPLYVIFCIIKFGLSADLEDANGVIAKLIPVTQWLGVSNSCINPFIYAFFNKKFRAGFKAIITSKTCCGTLRYDKYNSYYVCSYRGDIEKTKVVQMNGKASTFTKKRIVAAGSMDSMKTDLHKSRSVNYFRELPTVEQSRDSESLILTKIALADLKNGMAQV